MLQRSVMVTGVEAPTPITASTSVVSRRSATGVRVTVVSDRFSSGIGVTAVPTVRIRSRCHSNDMFTMLLAFGDGQKATLPFTTKYSVFSVPNEVYDWIKPTSTSINTSTEGARRIKHL
jgi:hypothetical protein